MSPSLPRVAAILVVRDGATWLGTVLAALAAQRYPALDVIAVDNGSRDGSAEQLTKRIHPEQLLRLPRPVGFGRAVAEAMRAEVVATADLVLLVHDDLALAPDAVVRLVRALQEDSSLGIVGPKLREWSDDYLLQEVGMTIDRFGRAEAQLEPSELDQGQHDLQRHVLYVSTAGMLVRTDVMRRLGGFDPRFPVLRDDLDLCWRAWLRGWRVEVVPGAVGYHIAGASRSLRRVGRGRAWEPRYLAERHTLAALLKNYGAVQLAWVLPVMLLLALGKVVGFLATRRLGDARAVVQAYTWNAGQLSRTLRRRRVIQRRRTATDAEVTALFAPGLPRVRAYAEVMGSWLAGGDTRALIDDADEEPGPSDDELAADPLAGRAALRFMRRHPALCVGVVLAVVYAVGLIPLLGRGQLAGGQIVAWPDTARAFLRAYASPWNGEPAASAAFASPAQPLLGILSFLALGSEWLAQRLLTLGLPVLAWLGTLRAGRLVTNRAAPRALGATLYALSPVVLGALAQGRYGVLVVAAILPGLVLVAVRAADHRTAPGSAWRAAALLSLGLVAGVGAEPTLGPVLGLGWLVTVVTVLVSRRPSWHQALARLVIAGAAAGVLLAPWLVGLVGPDLPPLGLGAADLPLWRAVLVVPLVLPGLGGAAGIVAAVAAGAVTAAGILLGLRARPRAVTALVAIVVAFGLSAWGADRLHQPWLWSPGLLLPAALALAGLGVVAARYLAGSLRSYTFGLRQLATVVAVGLVGVGIGAAGIRVAAAPWEGLRRAPTLVPAFVGADESQVGPYRVLLLDGDGEAVTWDLTAAGGPSMVSYGTVASQDLLDVVDAAVGTVAGGGDTGAGARLGIVGVRYVVLVGEEQAELRRALSAQPSLEPLPSGGGQVYRVRSWLPRAVLLPPAVAETVLATGDPGDTTALETSGLAQVRPGLHVGSPDQPDGGLLLVSEARSGLWEAGGAEVGRLERSTRAEEAGPVAPELNAFEVPADAGRLTTRASGGLAHRAVVVAQLLVALGIVSLALRPPGFTQRKTEQRLVRPLPPRLDDPTGPITVVSGSSHAAADEGLDAVDASGPAADEGLDAVDASGPAAGAADEGLDAVDASEPAAGAADEGLDAVDASEPGR